MIVCGREEADHNQWAKKSIPDMLKATEIPCAGGVIKITKASVDGDAFCNIRKGKKIYGFELKIKLEWEGTITGDSTVVKGSALLPYVCEDVDNFECK